MSQIAPPDSRPEVLSALRSLEGRATLGDVVAATGLDAPEARATLHDLLESRRGHLAVSDSGELLYEFDPALIERGREPLGIRLRRGATRLLKRGFKAWIVVMLVVYFVVFVALVIAAVVARQGGGGDRDGGFGGGRRGGHGRGGLPIPNLWFWYWIWGPRWRIGRPYYGHRWERTLEKDDRVPFYKKVFAFVFGPDEPRPTRRQLDRSTLRLIRARRGVLTAVELLEHTALPLPEAEEEMARLTGAYDAEPVVAPGGELAYAFPELMVSAHGRVEPREPNPAWLRLEYDKDLTGNTWGANALVAGMNGFTLVAAATAPWFIFPRLGLGGPLAWLGLVVVPVVFSLLFFALPGLRMLGVVRENRRRRARNVRRVTVGLVYRRALEERAVTEADAAEHAAARLEYGGFEKEAAVEALRALAAELDADVEPDADGALAYRFPAVRRAFAAGEDVRRRLALEEREPGDVVFHTADTTAEASARDLEAFDRELAGYVPATDRVGYEADYELVAFDEELERRGLVEA